jgi:competence protein ComEC
MNIQKLVKYWWKKAPTSRFRNFFSCYGKIGTVLLCSFTILVVLCRVGVNHKELRVSFLDVGQGDAIYISTPSGHDMLIDGGPNGAVIGRLSEVMSFFDRDIDVVVATHPDADHVTGLIPVLDRYTAHVILTSPISGHTGVFSELQDAIDKEGAEVVVAHLGTVIDFGDGVIAKVLYPNTTKVTSEETNDYSVSIELTYGDTSFVLTGDLPSFFEGDLIRNGLAKNVTIYKAAHHGSKTSSGVQLLSYMKPEYAVISAGKGNKYGHPHQETLERLAHYAKEVLSTIDSGTITFTTDGSLMSVETAK